MVKEENQNIDEHPMAISYNEKDERKLTFKQWIQHYKNTYGVSALSLLFFCLFHNGF